MKKLIAIVTIAVMVSTVAVAGNYSLMCLGNDSYTFRIDAGVAWYHDHRQYQYDISYQPPVVDALGLYVQTPVASIYGIDICIGGLSPLGYVERTKPEFSLNKTVWKNAEIGVSWMASPYNAYGLLVGWRF